MRDNFTADWAFGIKGAIENIVRSNFPRELRNWPLLQTFDFEVYTLSADYLIIILKDKLSGIPSGPGVPIPFPHTDHPTVPPKLSEMEVWQFYLRDKFRLREEDAPLVIPIHDSGKNSATDDYNLFNTEEKMFWDHQIRYVVTRQMNILHKDEPAMPNSPINITYNVSGTNTRVNINSNDSSTNISKIDNSVFSELRDASQQISDEVQRNQILNIINEMEKMHGTDLFLPKYKEFMSSISDHVTVFAPFIPALAGLLS
jgi:hypothetical protein